MKTFLFTDPVIYTVNNFINEKQCEHIIEISKDKIKPALVSGDKKGYISDGRTGQNCWLNHDTDDITLDIAKKISELLNVPLENAESFQVIYYDKSQQYKNHYDGWLFDNSEKSLRNMKYGGQRIWTALCYLNKPIKGGSTKFTKLDLEVDPEPGKLLVFSSVYEGTNKRHELSEHCGMPVIDGEKWAFNLWFRECSRSKLYDYPSNNLTISSNSMKHNEIFIPEVSNALYTSVLDKGDYIPYFVFKENNHKISIQNSAGKPIMFVIIEICDENIYRKYQEYKLQKDIHIYFICKTKSYKHNTIINSHDIYKLFPSGKTILTTPNLKIHKIYNNVEEISLLDDIQSFPKTTPPIIIIPNVISEDLTKELIDFYKNGNKKLELKGSKNRCHVYTDSKLTKQLDDKLSKSLFPEIKKIFNVDVTYRENYKICGYDAEDKGKFHAHRDSVYPYGHRRFAMSLILNDDYEGGGITFPEYNNIAYKPSPSSAVIFPTPLYHQVLEVTKGSRYVIISFLFGDSEAKYKKIFNAHRGLSDNINGYKLNVIRDQRNIIIDDICPQE